MARKVFFSFEYGDVARAMVVRNSGVIQGDEKAGFTDKAAFESIERQGEAAIKRWIDDQLKGTSVTVVLLGANTNRSKYVKYEIEQSIARGNGLLEIDISKVSALNLSTTDCCGTMLPAQYALYRWNNDKGRENIGAWIEKAAKQAGR
jgi:hypothetical protein